MLVWVCFREYLKVSVVLCLPLHQTPVGCSSSCRHHRQQPLHIHRRGRRARSASCDCHTEEGHTWTESAVQINMRQSRTEMANTQVYFQGFTTVVVLGQSAVKTGEKPAEQTKVLHLANAYPQPLTANNMQGHTVLHSNDKQCLMTCLSKAAIITKGAFCCQETFC